MVSSVSNSIGCVRGGRCVDNSIDNVQVRGCVDNSFGSVRDIGVHRYLNM